ncbi:MAG: hypothetical protein JSV81_14625 [Anaerolineales bacterium]|nr:MAG: hypothetical protein JSV81_14625 [Anaerolineales bacterium]
MLRPTLITWILIVFGLLTCGPLLYAQLVMLLQPHSQKAKDIMVGKGEDWRDTSHFKSAYALAWADWIFFMPVLVAGIAGVLLGQAWGFVLFAVAGAIQLYINLFLWFFEREYVYPAAGPLAYYTYVWGNFVYWGAATLVYSLLRLNGIS